MEITHIIQLVIKISITVGIVYYMIHLIRTWPDFKIYLLIGGIFLGPWLMGISFFASDSGTKEAINTAETMLFIGAILPPICIISIITILIKRWLNKRKKQTP